MDSTLRVASHCADFNRRLTFRRDPRFSVAAGIQRGFSGCCRAARRIECSPVDSPNCPGVGDDGRNPWCYLASRPANCVCDLVRFRSRHRNPGKERAITSSSRSIVTAPPCRLSVSIRLTVYRARKLTGDASLRRRDRKKTKKDERRKFPRFSPTRLSRRVPSNRLSRSTRCSSHDVLAVKAAVFRVFHVIVRTSSQVGPSISVTILL